MLAVVSSQEESGGADIVPTCPPSAVTVPAQYRGAGDPAAGSPFADNTIETIGERSWTSYSMGAVVVTRCLVSLYPAPNDPTHMVFDFGSQTDTLYSCARATLDPQRQQVRYAMSDYSNGCPTAISLSQPPLLAFGSVSPREECPPWPMDTAYPIPELYQSSYVEFGPGEIEGHPQGAAFVIDGHRFIYRMAPHFIIRMCVREATTIALPEGSDPPYAHQLVAGREGFDVACVLLARRGSDLIFTNLRVATSLNSVTCPDGFYDNTTVVNFFNPPPDPDPSPSPSPVAGGGAVTATPTSSAPAALPPDAYDIIPTCPPSAVTFPLEYRGAGDPSAGSPFADNLIETISERSWSSYMMGAVVLTRCLVSYYPAPNDPTQMIFDFGSQTDAIYSCARASLNLERKQLQYNTSDFSRGCPVTINRSQPPALSFGSIMGREGCPMLPLDTVPPIPDIYRSTYREYAPGELQNYPQGAAFVIDGYRFIHRMAPHFIIHMCTREATMIALPEGSDPPIAHKLVGGREGFNVACVLFARRGYDFIFSAVKVTTSLNSVTCPDSLDSNTTVVDFFKPRPTPTPSPSTSAKPVPSSTPTLSATGSDTSTTTATGTATSTATRSRAASVSPTSAPSSLPLPASSTRSIAPSVSVAAASSSPSSPPTPSSSASPDSSAAIASSQYLVRAPFTLKVKNSLRVPSGTSDANLLSAMTSAATSAATTAVNNLVAGQSSLFLMRKALVDASLHGSSSGQQQLSLAKTAIVGVGASFSLTATPASGNSNGATATVVNSGQIGSPIRLSWNHTANARKTAAVPAIRRSRLLEQQSASSSVCDTPPSLSSLSLSSQKSDAPPSAAATTTTAVSSTDTFTAETTLLVDVAAFVSQCDAPADGSLSAQSLAAAFISALQSNADLSNPSSPSLTGIATAAADDITFGSGTVATGNTVFLGLAFSPALVSAVTTSKAGVAPSVLPASSVGPASNGSGATTAGGASNGVSSGAAAAIICVVVALVAVGVAFLLVRQRKQQGKTSAFSFVQMGGKTTDANLSSRRGSVLNNSSAGSRDAFDDGGDNSTPAAGSRAARGSRLPVPVSGTGRGSATMVTNPLSNSANVLASPSSTAASSLSPPSSSTRSAFPATRPARGSVANNAPAAPGNHYRN